jgi:GNAT superfamily N-acetyltransferase
MTKRPPATEPAAARTIDDLCAEWADFQDGIPGIEVHSDPDIHWTVEAASAWGNCGFRVRFSPATVARRLDEILARYRDNGHGAGFWVGPFAQPENFEGLLAERGLRCRKYFPGMYADLACLPRVPKSELRLTFRVIADYSIFRKNPHPWIGRITTPNRRLAVAAHQSRAAREPKQVWEIMAVSAGVPVGVCTVFIGRAAAGFFDVGVIESVRNRGVGTALMAYAARFARDRGASAGVLISSGMGYQVYKRAGFREVSRIGFWYGARPWQRPAS